MTLLTALIVSALLTFGLIGRTTWPRLVVEEFPSRARRILAYAILTVALAIMAILPLSRLGRDAPPLRLEDMSFPEMFLGHALLLFCLLSWWALAGFRPLASFLHLRAARPLAQLRVGLAAGLGGWLVTMLAMATVGTLLGVTDDAAATVGDPEVPELVRAIVGLSVVQRLLLVLSAAVFEELFFRSFLQSRGGLVLSTVLFTASHSSYGLPLMLVGVFAVSLVIGEVFRRHDDVVPCIVAHGVFDAIQLFVVLPLVVRSG